MNIRNLTWKMERGETTYRDARELQRYIEDLEWRIRELERELEDEREQTRQAEQRLRQGEW